MSNTINFVKRLNRFNEMAFTVRHSYSLSKVNNINSCRNNFSDLFYTKGDPTSIDQITAHSTMYGGGDFLVIYLKGERRKLSNRFVIPIDFLIATGMESFLFPGCNEDFRYTSMLQTERIGAATISYKSFVLLYSILIQLPSDVFTKEELFMHLSLLEQDCWQLNKKEMHLISALVPLRREDEPEDASYPFRKNDYFKNLASIKSPSLVEALNQFDICFVSCIDPYVISYYVRNLLSGEEDHLEHFSSPPTYEDFLKHSTYQLIERLYGSDINETLRTTTYKISGTNSLFFLSSKTEENLSMKGRKKTLSEIEGTVVILTDEKLLTPTSFLFYLSLELRNYLEHKENLTHFLIRLEKQNQDKVRKYRSYAVPHLNSFLT